MCFVKPDGTGYRKDVGPAFGPLLWLNDSSAVVYQAMANEVETLGAFRCTPAGKPEAVKSGGQVTFSALPSGLLLLMENPPEDGGGTITCTLKNGVTATAPVLHTQSLSGTFGSGLLEPEGKYVAAEVQNDKGEATLWVGAANADMVRRVDHVKRVLCWARK